MDEPRERKSDEPDQDCYPGGSSHSPLPRIEAKEVFPPIKEGEFKNEDVTLSKETLALLKKRAGDLMKKRIPDDARGCQLCRMIVEDFKLNGKLTGHPNDTFEKGTFPVEAKVRHIQLEKGGL